MRIKDVLDEYRAYPRDEENYEVLTLTEKNGFIRQKDRFNKRLALADTSKYKVIDKEDFAFNPYLLWAGAIAKNSDFARGIISPLYPTFKVKPGYDPSYIQNILLSPQMIAAYDTISFGSVPRKRRASVDDFMRLPLGESLPPLDEQKRISDVLETLARQLEKVQTALESLRQMRLSLIEDYCATSELAMSLDSLAEVTGGLSLSGKRAVNPIECEYLRVANIQRNRFLIDDVKTIRCTEKELGRCLVVDGDILMLEANANPYEVGRAAIVETSGRQFVFQNHLFRIRPLDISSVVLNALLDSTFVRSQLLRVVKTTSGLNTMTINQARSLKVPQCEPAKNQLFELQLESLSRQTRRVQEKQDLLHELHNSLATRAFAWRL